MAIVAEIGEIEFVERTYVEYRWDPNGNEFGTPEMASQEGMDNFLANLVSRGAWDIKVRRAGYDDVLVGPNHWSEYA